MPDRRTPRWPICRLLLPVLLAPAVALAAGGTPSAPLPAEEKSPDQLAVDSYNRGLGARDRAWKLEEKAAATTDEGKRARLQDKIRRAYDNAIEDFSRAIEHNPRLFQAHSSLGYALRKTGRFEESLSAYDKALSLNPAYGEAIEYRAEAYLGLDRVEEAQDAYIRLFGTDRELAAELLDAMKRWLERKREQPGTLDAASLDAVGSWIAEREQIAGQTARAAPGRGRDAW